jgi:hypothetical protein
MTERPVLFDQTAYQAWLEQSTTGPGGAENSKYDTVPDLAVAWQRHEGQGGWLAEVVLDALHHDAGQQVWQYGPGISGLRLWATESPESGADGGVTAEVTADGVPLSLGHIPAGELIHTDVDLLPGYEAAGLALAELAARATTAVDNFRRGSALLGNQFGDWWGSMTSDDVNTAMHMLVAIVVDGSTAADMSEPQLAVIDQVLALRTEALEAEIVIVDGEIVD